MASKRRHRRKNFQTRMHGDKAGVVVSNNSSLYNPVSGMGGASDKTRFTRFSLMHRPQQQELDNLYYQSWAARKLVDLPVDDMLRRWREWVSDDPRMSSALADVEEFFEIRKYLVRTAKLARLYGSALLILVDKEEEMGLPLDVSAWRPGRLVGLRSVGSYDYSVPQIDRNFLSSTYGEARHYLVHSHYGAPVIVHPSRVLRFWGLEPLSNYVSWMYDMRYGMSILQPILATLLEEKYCI